MSRPWSGRITPSKPVSWRAFIISYISSDPSLDRCRLAEITAILSVFDVSSVDKWHTSLHDEFANNRWNIVVRIFTQTPVQIVKPLANGFIATIARISAAFLKIRGKPNNGIGGSSGWMAIWMWHSSQTGRIASRKYLRLAARRDASTSA